MNLNFLWERRWRPATASFDAGLMTYFREAVVNTQEMLDLLVLTQC